MSSTAWPENSLTDFYQRQLLPTAFERLDQLDPASAWRAADFGWRGVSGERARTCFQPWGFVDAAGGAHSWLASFSGRLPASAGEFLEAVDRLAQLLGLEDSLDVQRVPPYDLFAAYLQFRQDSLFETFLGLAQHQLGAPAGANARAALADRFGVDDGDVAAWPLGIYPEPQELFARLRSAGFSSDEIGWSAVLGDQRLPGRLLVPWRDRWGRLSTVVARDWQAPATAPGRQLLLPAGTRSQIFGLDVALRAEAGHGPHIYVAEGLLEVVALQARGVRNVCSAGRLGAPLTADFWQELTAAGVREATLLLRSGAGRGAREVAAVEAAAGLFPAPITWVHSGRGETAKELASAKGVANVLAKRQAGFTVAAQRIVERHADLERQDSQLALLSEAVAFDELVRDPERQADLEQQFWPVIEQALGGRWPALRASRTVATGSLEQRQDRAARVRLYARLLTDLHVLLAGRDVVGFERRLREILGPELPPPAPEPAFQPAPTPSMGTWELIELKPVPASPPRPVEAKRDWLDPLPSTPPGAEVPNRTEPPAPEPPARPAVPPLTTSSPPAPRVPRIMPRAVNPDDVRLRAYCLWEKHGRPEGREVYFWAMAERELRGEASATLASPPASH
ncbi:MAG: DUF2934 domain-containing protein [Pirellulales bacterium]